jgi:hypothetical protein
VVIKAEQLKNLVDGRHLVIVRRAILPSWCR